MAALGNTYVVTWKGGATGTDLIVEMALELGNGGILGCIIEKA